MKHSILHTISILFLFQLSFAQVSIGKENIQDGLMLEISSDNKGVIIPAVSLQSRNSKAPLVGDLPTGSVIFNTSNFGSFPNETRKGFYWWNNENAQWFPMATSSENVSCQYANQDISIDYHGATYGVYQNMDLFANLVYTESFDIYQKLNNTSLKINFAGLYAITVNLDMYKGSSNNDPVGLSTRIMVNGNQRGTVQFWRAQENEHELSHSFTEYLELNDGDVLSIQSARSTTSNHNRAIKFREAGSSNISIQRIR